MKNILVFVFAMVSLVGLAQDKSLDPKLIGSWKGSEKDKQYEGVEKHWVQHRFEDGTYLILFTIVYYTESRVESAAEKGKWWIEDGKFYEDHGNEDMPDVYTYKIIDDDHVKFKMAEGAMGFNDPEYEFIDIRIKEDSM